MTTDGQATPLDAPLARIAVCLVGVAVLAASITILFLSMRAVLDIGGACASGGPYVARVECPDVVVAMTPLSIFAALGGIGLMLWGAAAIPGPWAGLVFLAWPALFQSLGWNFLEYGFFPPAGADGWVWMAHATVRPIGSDTLVSHPDPAMDYGDALPLPAWRTHVPGSPSRPDH
jgi:hypothetical protein